MQDRRSAGSKLHPSVAQGKACDSGSAPGPSSQDWTCDTRKWQGRVRNAKSSFMQLWNSDRWPVNPCWLTPCTPGYLLQLLPSLSLSSLVAVGQGWMLCLQPKCPNPHTLSLHRAAPLLLAPRTEHLCPLLPETCTGLGRLCSLCSSATQGCRSLSWQVLVVFPYQKQRRESGKHNFTEIKEMDTSFNHFLFFNGNLNKYMNYVL